MSMKKTILYATRVVATLSVIGLFNHSLNAQLIENFDNITTLPAAGWVQQNNSSPLGAIGWFQGNAAAFPAYNGASDSYIGANFNNVNSSGTISNWLITPNLTLKNGDVISFFTRTSSDNMWADRLQVRMSTNGASANVGTGPTTVGDFTTMLLEINPNLQLSVYPMTWTQYTITISGLSAPTSGRIAFRYFVTNGGINGTNSDYIGIDNFVYSPYVCPTLNVSPSTLNAAFAGLPFNQSITQTGALGNANFTLSAGALPPGLSLTANGTLSGTPSATGNYSFSITVTDASGCTGTQSYNMNVQCNPNGASLNNLPTLCSNSNPITLTQGMPTGGAYSGNGVTGDQFNPSVGTQSITYSVNDAYGCLQTAAGTITVNTAPNVTLSPFANLCFNEPPVVLTGGLPAGGTYSGTSVSGGIFTPNAVGQFTITYSVTDANNCSGNTTQTLNVLNCVGIDEHQGGEISVYPNPSTGILNIDLGENLGDVQQIRIRNTSGQVVKTFDLNTLLMNESSMVLDFHDISNGLYFVELIGKTDVGFIRVVLEK
jgi:hypothetical protein